MSLNNLAIRVCFKTSCSLIGPAQKRGNGPSAAGPDLYWPVDADRFGRA